MKIGLVVVVIFFCLYLIGCVAALSNPKVGIFQYTNKTQNNVVVRTIPIWIDGSFGAGDRLEIDDAIDKWNYALNRYIKLDVVDRNFNMEVGKLNDQVRKNGWLILKIDSISSIIPTASQKGYHVLGFTNKIGGDHLYLVRDRMQNEEVFGITLHEIGHALGVDHVGSKLMYKNYSKARFRCIDYDTIKAVAIYQHLDVNNLNYCFDN